MNDERMTSACGQSAALLSVSMPRTLRLRRSSSPVHHSSFIIHHFLFLVCLLLGASQAAAEDNMQTGWDAWEQIPVLYAGRIQPLDSFARAMVREICGSESPRLSLAGATVKGEDDSVLASSQVLFPGGGPRRFRASELLLSWMVEPERWQRVPLVPGVGRVARVDILRLPLRDAVGGRLRRASPLQVATVTEATAIPNSQTNLDSLQRVMAALPPVHATSGSLTAPQTRGRLSSTTRSSAARRRLGTTNSSGRGSSSRGPTPTRIKPKPRQPPRRQPTS